MLHAPDKKAAPIKTLKDVNKQLSELFAELVRRNTIITTCATDISYIAHQCGDLRVETFVGNNREIGFAGIYLEKISAILAGARS